MKEIIQFYEIDSPEYAHDYDFKKYNPIDISDANTIPWVECDLCGERWGNVISRIPNNLSSRSNIWESIKEPSLPIEKHIQLRDAFEKEIGFNIEMGKFPGMVFGESNVRILSENLYDFIWSTPGVVFVKEIVAKQFSEHKITGCEFLHVNIDRESKIGEEIYEVYIYGKAGKAAKKSGIAIKSSCKKCGRIEHTTFRSGIIVDPNNWDGTDICTIEEYPTYILVSEKIKQILEKNNFSNYRLNPLKKFS